MAGEDGEPGDGSSHGKRRAALIRAINHPLRRRMLRLLLDLRQRLSPVEMARALGLTVSDTSYHARVLCNLGAVAPAGERQVRGALQRFYEAAIEDDPPIETLLEETREFDERESTHEEDK
jgi:DNA-binding transcriptional ArsR family regulator